MIDLEELERLAAQATPGPWKADNWSRVWHEPKQGVRRTVADCVRVTVKSPKRHRANARLIAAMHEALPELIAELKEARAEGGELKRHSEWLERKLQLRIDNNAALIRRVRELERQRGLLAGCLTEDPPYCKWCGIQETCQHFDTAYPEKCKESIIQWAEQAAKEAGE